MGVTRTVRQRRRKAKVDIRSEERGGNLGLILTARPVRLHGPTLSVNGLPVQLRRDGDNGVAGVQVMERNMPYQIEPFPFRIQRSVSVSMVVRVDITDGESERAGDATPGADVRIVEGRNGLVALPMGVFPPFEFTFDADELDDPIHHSYSFMPYIEKGQTYRPGTSPSIVKVGVVEKRRWYRFWKRLGRKGLRTL